MKNSVLILFAFLFTIGCTSPSFIQRTTDTDLIKNPYINRIESAYPNKKHKTRINGYFKSLLKEPKPSVLKDTFQTQNTSHWTNSPYTETRIYNNHISEPQYSFGGEVTYGVSDLFGAGGHIDISYISQDTTNFKDSVNSSIILFGLHTRFTKTFSLFTFAYRPEISFGILSGNETTTSKYDSVVSKDTSRYHFKKFHCSFTQSLALNISPLKFLSAFAGVQYKVDPYFFYDENTFTLNSASFYTGISVDLLKTVSITPWFSKPIKFEPGIYGVPFSAGISLGLRL
jgi:hypothetical protein